MFYKQRARPAPAFTLLEVVLVLLILLLICGMALPAMSGLVAQQRLKSQAKALEAFATSARKLAVTQDRPYEIILAERGFSLQRLGADEKEKVDVLGTVKLSSNVAYTVQRWGADAFGKPAGVEWVFRPDGICEPIRVHFESGDGWVEFTFNPLTARTQDETFHFP